METIRRYDNSLLLLDSPPGIHVRNVVADVIEFGYGGFVFNGIVIRVHPDDTEDSLLRKYETKTNREY